MQYLIKNIILLLTISFFISSTFAREGNPNFDIVYKGPVYNIFFHPLIAYPKIAFDNKNKQLEYMNSWFVTTNEFKKILPELYKNGFVLFSPKDIFKEEKDRKGQINIVRKNIFLPLGKKPLIISLDDYNFYNSMKLNGTIHRFWIDPYNRLATITDTSKNKRIIRYDQEIPQLLEEFITVHPDFSFNRARGIFALTGYNGIFGYDTHKPYALDYSSQLNEAKKVVKKLKEMGWEFGSHSYFHLTLEKQTEAEFEQSEKLWRKEVGSLVGPTSYYIFPFGDRWDKNQTRMNFLNSLGNKYFFGVSSSQSMTIQPGLVIMKRYPMDGLAMRNQYKDINTYITPAQIIDPDRPPAKSTLLMKFMKCCLPSYFSK